jgi:hypothetical protein
MVTCMVTWAMFMHFLPRALPADYHNRQRTGMVPLLAMKKARRWRRASLGRKNAVRNHG